MSAVSDEGWRLTRALSPRPYVRIADELGTGGEVLNSFRGTRDLNTPTPTTPWAMHLADKAGLYRYLCFDFDASRGNAPYDAGRLSLWLDDANVPHVTAASGPTGGRHIWIALDHGSSPATVADLARMAAHLLPSLDITPLLNPATGCARPPGAPHRVSGYSSVIAGSPQSLAIARVTAENLVDLRTLLGDAGAEIPSIRMSPAKGMNFDETGHPHLLGARRHLTPRISRLLDAPPEADTSVALARVLAGAARARWRFADVHALLPHSPALEHARTRAATRGREPVRPDIAVKRLAAAWSRAVYFAAANPIDVTGADDTFLDRIAATSARVEQAQRAANLTPGIWGFDSDSRAARAHRGRRVHRLVLDAVCLYLAQSAQEVVEVDTRRLAADTGYGRESCRLALLALADPDARWLVQTEQSAGAHGGRFRLHERFSTATESPDRAQAVTHPQRPAARLENRTRLIHELSTSLAPLAHDTFAAPRSLGRTAGRVYAALTPGATIPLNELARRAHTGTTQTRRALHRLDAAALAGRTDAGWQREETADLDTTAGQLNVSGYLEARRDRYATERAVWNWWQAEHHWMKKRRKRRRRAGSTGLPLFAQSDRTEYPSYPRGSDRRADHRRAKDLARAGALRPPDIWAVA